MEYTSNGGLWLTLLLETALPEREILNLSMQTGSQGEKPIIEYFRVGEGLRSTAVNLAGNTKDFAPNEFLGLTPDCASIFVHGFTASEVYAVDLDAQGLSGPVIRKAKRLFG